MTPKARSICLFAGRYLLGFAGCCVVLVAAPFSARHREILHEILFRLGWRRRPLFEPALPALEIPEVPLSDVVGAEMNLRILDVDAVDGNVSTLEIMVISAVAARIAKSACLEIGTFDGRTTLNLAANTPAACRIYTLDLPDSELGRTELAIAPGDENFIRKPLSGGRFGGTAYAERITQLWGDSASFDFSPYQGQMDLVFVDGSHSYDYVKADTDTALKLLKPGGGIILWHDYGSRYWKDLTRAMNELYRERPELRSMRHIAGTTLVVWEKGELLR